MKSFIRTIIITAVFCLTPTILFSQSKEPATATYFESGINSPWTIGIDYDVGFAGVLSFNISFQGGISSQVNKVSTFGDIFFGEFTTGFRLYMNKIDRWEGAFLCVGGRVGIYSIPFRIGDTQLILERGTIPQYGFNVYFGYRWKRNLVSDMSNLPFMLMIEPYLGWSMDFFVFNSAVQNVNGINRLSIGISLKLGFYTYKKSKKTLEAEAAAKTNNSTNTVVNNTNNTQ
ncbi:MAG: hypothetical protein ACRCTQ_05480 [Brevinemataceae bacterium]